LALAGDNDRLIEVGDRLLAGLAAVSSSAVRVAQAHLRLARAAIVASRWSNAARHLESAAPCRDETSRVEAAVLASQLALGQGHPDEAVSLARAARAGAERAGRHDLACEALEVIGRRERERDLAKAEQSFAAALAVAETHGLSLWRIRALHELGTIDLLAGRPIERLSEARQAALGAGALATAATVQLQMTAWFLNHFELDRVIDAARSFTAEARRLRLPIVEALGLLFGSGAYALRGQRSEMEAGIRAALAVAGDDPEVRGIAALQMRAALWLVREDRARALAELDAGMDLLRATPATAPFRGMWALMHAIEDEDGDAVIAEVEASGQTVYWLIRGWVGHARAVSFGQKGQRSEAEDAFAQADADLAPCAWYRQHARRLVAEAAIAHGWGDPTGWLTEALVFFDREGYGPIASACRSLLRRAGAPVPRRRRPVADVPASLASMGLTAREVEVLALLATASPTREIAARLYVSPKTVERHIANLAHKVGAEGRSELIAFAASQLSGSDGALDTEP
jgi:DNA-binding CsgD family transcriptional regulator